MNITTPDAMIINSPDRWQMCEDFVTTSDKFSPFCIKSYCNCSAFLFFTKFSFRKIFTHLKRHEGNMHFLCIHDHGRDINDLGFVCQTVLFYVPFHKSS